MKFDPYKGNESYIFISYAHKDKESVWPILRRMISCGYRIWYDEGIVPGKEWDIEIAEHIEKCGYFIAFVSKQYLDSNNCKDELNYARNIEKTRLLIYLEPTELNPGMSMRLNRWQAIYKYTYDNEEMFFEKLYHAQNIKLFIDDKKTGTNKDKILTQNIDKNYERNGFDIKRYYLESQEPTYINAMEAYFNLEYEKAFNLFLDSYKNGNKLSALKLAQLYYYQEGCEKSKKKALELFAIAKSDGYPLAAVWISDFYRLGEEIPEDIEKSKYIYDNYKNQLEEMALQGDPDAQYFLGYNLLFGINCDENQNQGFFWIQKAKKKGHPKGRLLYAICYANGWGCRKDKIIAYAEILILKKINEKKDDFISLKFEYAKLLYWGIENSTFDPDYNKAFQFFKEIYNIYNGRVQRAKDYYSRKGEFSVVSVIIYLAACYWTGRGTEFDFREAYKTSEIAVMLSNKDQRERFEKLNSVVEEIENTKKIFFDINNKIKIVKNLLEENKLDQVLENCSNLLNQVELIKPEVGMELKVEILEMNGKALCLKKNNKKASISFKTAIDILEKDILEKSCGNKTLNEMKKIAQLYVFLGETIIPSDKKMIFLRLTINNRSKYIQCLKRALEYYRKIVLVDDKIYMQYIAIIQINLALMYVSFGDVETAKKSLEEAKGIFYNESFVKTDDADVALKKIKLLERLIGDR